LEVEKNMAAIDDLIKQVKDIAIRQRLTQELERINDKRKFGLVFEDHLPELTPVYGLEIKRGSSVTRKGQEIYETYFVEKIHDGLATCVDRANGQKSDFPLDELVVVAQFGEPIFPSLGPMDIVRNGENASVWHTLIESENYHALELLEYLYSKQVDCIYIDPPYNTGARDWKYNNDYVDSSDRWRHSKWLSMMQRRLKIVRKLLKPDTGVLIVTIDEHELHHLRTLLEQIFPEAKIQIVTIVTNPKGVARGRFSRVEEYAIYCFMPNAFVAGGEDPMLGEKPSTNEVRWASLLRSGTDAQREDSKNQFYPVLVDTNQGRVVRAGGPLPIGMSPQLGEKIDDFEVAWPIRSDLSEGRWMLSSRTLNELIKLGYVKLGKYDARRKTWVINYLSEKSRKKIDSGEITILGRDEVRNSVIVSYVRTSNRQIKTVWYRSTHDAGAYGSDLLTNIIGQSRKFTFPKSLYAVRDSIGAVVRDNPNALIIDFFAGSGTTLHAVNLLNYEDSGRRQCILVTNNEVSEDQAKILLQQGHFPGDQSWENKGICQSVTWPRIKYSVLGKRDDGSIIEGEYFTNRKCERNIPLIFHQISFTTFDELGTIKKKKQLVSLLGKDKLPQSLVESDSRFIVSCKHSASILFDDSAYEEWFSALEGQDNISEFYIVTQCNSLFNTIKDKIEELIGNLVAFEDVKKPMSEGFRANVAYFKLGFLDKNRVELGQQFREILPMLWMKAGAVGEPPLLPEDAQLPPMLVPEANNFAVLIDEAHFAEFIKMINARKNISSVFIVTDSEEAFREMASEIDVRNVTQLYRDYIDNFVINGRRI